MTSASTIDRQQVDIFERVRHQIEVLSKELAILSKKDADAKINAFKLQIVNERLQTANSLLTGVHQPFANFREFENEQLPSVSDVVVVLSQYLSSLEGWRSANVRYDGLWWTWNIRGASLRAEPATRAHKVDEP